MALSEHERRMFAEIERQLVAEDPRFVARSRRRLTAWSPTVRLRAAVVLGALGLVGVLSLTFDIIYGALGMAALLAAMVLGVSARTDRARAAERPVGPDGR